MSTLTFTHQPLAVAIGLATRHLYQPKASQDHNKKMFAKKA